MRVLNVPRRASACFVRGRLYELAGSGSQKVGLAQVLKEGPRNLLRFHLRGNERAGRRTRSKSRRMLTVRTKDVKEIRGREAIIETY
jgi:hypothetical protein